MRSNTVSKQKQLMEIISRLGEDATPAEIREEAYRVGFGAINGRMLMHVRNKLWPGRKRRAGGYFRDNREAKAAGEAILSTVVPCPKCHSKQVWNKSRYRLKGKPGFCTRKRFCKNCGHEWTRTERDKNLPKKQKSRIQWALVTEIKCTYCQRTLPVEAFSLRHDSDIARRPGCKECYADQRAQHDMEKGIYKKYGITFEQYETLLEQQGGRCKICGTTDPFGYSNEKIRTRKRRPFSIDHCHVTGKVRGLLCARCNLAIGNFADDTDLMRKAIAYIEHHRQTSE